MDQIFDTVNATEFEALVDQYIHREDPDALSMQALDEAARLQLAEATTPCVEGTGRTHEGHLIFDPPPNAPILTYENGLIIDGVHVVINLHAEQTNA
jgi:hypothetical protein